MLGVCTFSGVDSGSELDGDGSGGGGGGGGGVTMLCRERRRAGGGRCVRRGEVEWQKNKDIQKAV